MAITTEIVAITARYFKASTTVSSTMILTSFLEQWDLVEELLEPWQDHDEQHQTEKNYHLLFLGTQFQPP